MIDVKLSQPDPYLLKIFFVAIIIIFIIIIIIIMMYRSGFKENSVCSSISGCTGSSICGVRSCWCILPSKAS